MSNGIHRREQIYFFPFGLAFIQREIINDAIASFEVLETCPH
jgi:hypothetical protein